MKSDTPILLVEDDAVDAMAIKRALKEVEAPGELKIVGNGEEALDYLRDNSNEMPGIILTDLNMPRMNGIELIRELKNDDALKRIPVIVLTTSKEEQDRIESFNLSAAGYMIKPIDHHQFVDVVKTINMYWSMSELP